MSIGTAKNKTIPSDKIAEAFYPVALLLLLFVLVCTGLPLPSRPTWDDISFVHTTRALFLTGHIAYNGWAAMPLVPQAYFGSLFLHFFGDSFASLVLLNLFVFAGVVLTLYYLAKRCGVPSSLAFFLTLTVCGSQTILPIALTFMTDLFGLFLFLVTVYLAVRCLQATTLSQWVRFSVFHILVGFLAGLERQIFWLVPMVCLPLLFFFAEGIRGRFSLKLRALMYVGVTVLLLGAIGLAVRWFLSQPNVPDVSDIQSVSKAVSLFFWLLFKAVLTLTVLLSPVLAYYLRSPLATLLRRPPLLAGLLALCCGIALVVQNALFHHWPYLFIYETSAWGIYTAIDHGGYWGKFCLFVSSLVTVFVILTVCMLCATFAVSLRKAPKSVGVMESLKRFVQDDPLAILLLSLSLVCFGAVVFYGAVVTQNVLLGIYDRYFPPIVAVFSIFLLRQTKDKSPRSPIGFLPCALLIILLVFGVIYVHGLGSFNRALLTAFDLSVRQGYKPTEIGTNTILDLDTQLRYGGGIAQYKPLGSKQEIPPRPVKWPLPDPFRFCDRFPAVVPKVVFQAEDSPLFPPSNIKPIFYSFWFPPFHDKLVIQRVKSELQ